MGERRVCLGQSVDMLDADQSVSKPSSYAPFYSEYRPTRFFDRLGYHPKHGRIVEVTLANMSSYVPDWKLLEQRCRAWFGVHPNVEESTDSRAWSRLTSWKVPPGVVVALQLTRLKADSITGMAFLLIAYDDGRWGTHSDTAAAGLDREEAYRADRDYLPLASMASISDAPRNEDPGGVPVGRGGRTDLLRTPDSLPDEPLYIGPSSYARTAVCRDVPTISVQRIDSDPAP